MLKGKAKMTPKHTGQYCEQLTTLWSAWGFEQTH